MLFLFPSGRHIHIFTATAVTTARGMGEDVAMRFQLRFCILAVVAILAASIGASTFAADGRFVSQKGSWILNRTESKIPPGTFAPPENPMVVSEDNGEVLKFILYELNAATGLQPGIPFEGAYDGKFYPYGKDAERSFTHISPNSFHSIVQSPSGWSATEVVTFTANNTKMRVEGKYTDKSGKVSDYVQVWDKLL